MIKLSQADEDGAFGVQHRQATKEDFVHLFLREASVVGGRVLRGKVTKRHIHVDAVD